MNIETRRPKTKLEDNRSLVKKSLSAFFVTTLAGQVVPIVFVLIVLFISNLLFINSPAIVASLNVLLLLILVIDFVYILLRFLIWRIKVFKITKDSISAKYQVSFFNNERVFQIHSPVNLRLRQGTIGKIFNYGSIVLEASNLEITLDYINEPQNVKKLLDDIYVRELSGPMM